MNRESIETVFRTGKPAYSNVFTGAVIKARIVTVSVPVIRDGQVIYEVSFNPPLEIFQEIIQRQRPNEDWTLSIFESAWQHGSRAPKYCTNCSSTS